MGYDAVASVVDVGPERGNDISVPVCWELVRGEAGPGRVKGEVAIVVHLQKQKLFMARKASVLQLIPSFLVSVIHLF